MFKNIFKRLKGSARELSGSALSVSEEQTMESMVAAMVRVAYADDTCSNEEVDKANAVIKNSPQLREFHNEPVRLFDSYCDQMETSSIQAKRDLKAKVGKMIGDVQGSERVLIAAIEIAYASHDEEDETPLSDSEEQVLSDIARELDLRLGQYI